MERPQLEAQRDALRASLAGAAPIRAHVLRAAISRVEELIRRHLEAERQEAALLEVRTKRGQSAKYVVAPAALLARLKEG